MKKKETMTDDDAINIRDCGWTGIEDDYPVSIREVLDITAETGALYTQNRVRELKPYRLPQRKTGWWIIHKDWLDEGLCGYECPNCGRCYDYAMNFCGFCGAKMGVGHE